MKKRVLVFGNLGYVGSSGELEKIFGADYTLVGFDAGYFSKNVIANYGSFPDISHQLYGDVRNLDFNILRGFDTIIYLAALSNDPMGNKFEKQTFDINYKSAIKIAMEARKLGVKRFIFASSCSIYGISDKDFVNEESSSNPQTAYAESKYLAERELKQLSDNNFKTICLRFATAAGPSHRIRFDLFLNDFILEALAKNTIKILSDGAPWRPVVDVRDMVNAFKWAVDFDFQDNFTLLNIGRNDSNFQLIDFAEKIKNILNCNIDINKQNPVDSRSYRVDFSLFNNMSGGNVLKYNIDQTINDTIELIRKIDIDHVYNSKSSFFRLLNLESLQKSGFFI